jgi:methionyl-tRNA synthetase
MKGHDVIFVSGSDEHGTPVEIEAIKRNIPVKEFADNNHLRIVNLFKEWGISFDNYTRTENQTHVNFVQDHFRAIYEKNYIFEKEELIHFCPHDKKFLPDRFVEGTCPWCNASVARGDQCDNCSKPVDAENLQNARCAICGNNTEIRKTNHWFLDLPRLSQKIKEYIINNKEITENAANFSLSLIEEGLKPRSLTRDTSWGIPAPFPGAEGKTIYVWMEAVLGYISATIEYFKKINEEKKWEDYWLNTNTKTAYFIGKDNIHFHTIIFPALLMASKRQYILPHIINSTEFLLFEGKKFSKSRKIGIWIDEAINILPKDYWRYSLLALRPETGDVNFTYELLEEKINSELNDKIGNFINRTLVAIKKFMNGKMISKPSISNKGLKLLQKIEKNHDNVDYCYSNFRIQRAVKMIIEQSEEGNRYLNLVQPWKIFKQNPKETYEALYIVARIVKALAVELSPIIPDSARTISNFLGLKSSSDFQEAKTDFDYPLVLNGFYPLFTKIKKEEIIKKLSEIRSKKGD